MKEMISRMLRILHISRKPTRKELEEIMRITGTGVVVVGTIGVVFFLIFSVI